MPSKQKKQIPSDWVSTPYFFTKDQVATVLGYSKKHLEDLVAQGLFPAPLRLNARCAPRWISTTIAKAMKETA